MRYFEKNFSEEKKITGETFLIIYVLFIHPKVYD